MSKKNTTYPVNYYRTFAERSERSAEESGCKRSEDKSIFHRILTKSSNVPNIPNVPNGFYTSSSVKIVVKKRNIEKEDVYVKVAKQTFGMFERSERPFFDRILVKTETYEKGN